MSGVYDAINVGQFTFGLMRSNFNVQLSVGQMGTPGNVGGLFALETVPTSTWIRLEDRQCRKLPVWGRRARRNRRACGGIRSGRCPKSTARRHDSSTWMTTSELRSRDLKQLERNIVLIAAGGPRPEDSARPA